MKITGGEILHCDAGWRDFSFLELRTDDGITGISEFNESYGSPGIGRVVEQLLERWVVGEDPMAITRIGAKLYAATRQAAGGMVQQAIAAIENALLDIKGKALGVPVCDLLGGAVRDRLELYWSHCGSYRFGPAAEHIDGPPIATLDDLSRLASEVAARGFLGLKTNIFLFGDGGEGPRLHMPGFAGTAGWPELNASPRIIQALRRQLTAMRDGAGPDVGIHLDLNFNFKTEGYLQVTRGLDDLGLTWFEIDTYNPDALAHIRRSVRTPIASCESLFGTRGFRPYFELAAMDVAIVDVPWNGAWEALRIASMADAYEVNVAPHNFYGHLSTLMSAHFCAAIPNFRVMEIDIDDVPWKDELVTRPPAIVDGHLVLPREPGWGTELNRDAILAHPPRRPH